MDGGLLLSFPCSAFLPQSQPQLWPLRNPTSSLSLNLYVLPRLLRCARANSRRWDSNAETIRSQKFSFRSGDNDDDDADNEGDNEDVVWSDMTTGYSGFLEEALDSVWIFKVFSSFGWMLPFIILSMLLATGLKAFLMALTLPLGQSAISLAFKKLSGRTKSRPKRKTRTKRKPSASTASNVEMEEEEEQSSRGNRRRKMGYQSWAPGNNGSVNESDQGAPTFGGWEELDEEREFDMGSMQTPSWRTGGRQRKSVEKGKFSRRERKGETPLLLRLLIAAFPFLGSWTKVLW